MNFLKNMSLKTPLFRKVTIVGVGLMGGSLGMAIKKHNIAREVVGISQKNSPLSHALKNNVIDHVAADLKSAVQNADLVILATPVKTIINILSTIGPHLRRHCIVTDVGSTKASIVEAAQKFLPPHVLFVGSHPLAGSEKKGSAYATADLFEGAMCIMTPVEHTNRLAKEKVKHFWMNIGCTVKMLPPEEHDKIVAYISHLPHLVAYGLMGAVPPEYLEYAAQGFKDTTRVASSSPQMWNDICMVNKKNIVKSLDELVKNLAAYRKAIIAKDETGLMDHFIKAKAKRDSFEKNG